MKQIAELGREVFGIHVLMFGSDDLQPDLFALCYDLPVQLQQLLEFCSLKNVPLDNTSVNAQQGELVNRVLKIIIETMSAHKHVTNYEKDDQTPTE